MVIGSCDIPLLKRRNQTSSMFDNGFSRSTPTDYDQPNINNSNNSPTNDENKNLTEKYKKLKNEYKILRQKLMDSENDLELARQEIDELVEHNERLKSQLQQSNNGKVLPVHEIETYKNEIQNLRIEIGVKNDQNHDLKTRLERIQGLKGNNGQASNDNEAVKKLNVEIERLKEIIEGLESDVCFFRSKAEENKSENINTGSQIITSPNNGNITELIGNIKKKLQDKLIEKDELIKKLQSECNNVESQLQELIDKIQSY